MPRIQEYTQQVLPQGEAGGRRASGEDMGADIGRSIVGLANSAATFMAHERKLEEQKEVSDLRAKITEWQLTKAEEFDELTKTARPGDDIVGTMKESAKTDLETFRSSYKTRAAQDYINTHIGATTNHYLTRSISLQSTLAAQKAKNDEEVAIQNSGNIVRKNPDMYSFVVAGMEHDYTNKAGSHAKLNYETSSNLFEFGKKKIAWDAATGTVENPAARAKYLAPINKYTSRGFDSIANYMIDKHEGGFVEDDNGKGNTKHGINISSNPEVDVKNLTKEGAKQIYRTKYWDAVGVGSVSPEFQPLVFDAAVNQGQSFAKQLISAIDGGATKDDIIALRKAAYQSSVDNNENNRKYLKGWIARVDSMAKIENKPEDGDVTEMVDNADPWFNELSTERKLQFLNMVKQKEKVESVSADKTLRKIIQDHITHMLNTQELPAKPLTLANFRGNDDAFEEYSAMMEATKAMAAVRTSPPAEQIKLLEALKPKESLIPGLETKQWKIYNAAVKMKDASDDNRRKDPMGEAEKSKLLGDKNVTFSNWNPTNFDTFFTEMKSQIVNAETVADIYKTPLTYGSNQWKEWASKNFNGMNYEAQFAFLKQSKKELGVEKTMNLLDSMGKGDSVSKVIANIDLDRGDNAIIARTMMLGRSYLNPAGKLEAGEKGEAGAAKSVLPQFKDARRLVGEKLKGLSGYPEEAMGRITESAMAYYVGSQRVNESAGNLSLDKKNSGNHTLFNEAVDKIFGKPEKFGQEMTIKPIGMSSTAFRTNIMRELKTVAPELNAQTIGLRAHPSGGYIVTQGGSDAVPDGKGGWKQVILNPSKYKSPESKKGSFKSKVMDEETLLLLQKSISNESLF